MTDQKTVTSTAAISAAQEATFAALVEIGRELDKNHHLNAVEFIAAWKNILQLGHMTNERMHQALGKPEEKAYKPQTWSFNLDPKYAAMDSCPDSETVRRSFIWLALELSATSLNVLKNKATVRSMVTTTSVVTTGDPEDVEQAPGSCMPDGRPWNTTLVDDPDFVHYVSVRGQKSLAGEYPEQSGSPQNEPILTIKDLVVKTEGELLRRARLGRKSLNEIKEFLSQEGLHLGMDIE